MEKTFDPVVTTRKIWTKLKILLLYGSSKEQRVEGSLDDLNSEKK